MNMIEKGSRAICGEIFNPEFSAVTKESYIDYNWKLYVPHFKAAIEVMREPIKNNIRNDMAKKVCGLFDQEVKSGSTYKTLLNISQSRKIVDLIIKELKRKDAIKKR